MSDRICVLKTIGGASSLASLANDSVFCPVMRAAFGGELLQPATARAAMTLPQ